MGKRLLFLLRTYCWTVVVFLAAKVGFMVYCTQTAREALGSASAGSLLSVLTHGLSLDLSTALYFLLVPFLAMIVSTWWSRESTLKKVLLAYYTLVSAAFALAFVADSCLYPFWRFKLDASCLQYLETPTEAAASVTGLYIAAAAVAFALTAILIYGGYHWLVHRLAITPVSDWRHRLGATLLYVALTPLIVIGIRGGTDESTTNIGQVYFSQEQFLNHSAVNPVFSFLASLEKTANQNTSYDFYSEAECQALVADFFTTESADTDTLLNTQRPNVVIILLESCGSMFLDVMPNLRSLQEEGVTFDNCYGNTWRTDRGTVCTLSGYPSFPTMSVMKMPAKTRTLPSIAKSLQKEGYKTHYLYGGDINFTNMRSYLMATGWEQLTWKADYTAAEQRTGKWGVRDDITFKTLSHLVRQKSQQHQPFLIGYSTLSSHEPWDVPVSQYADKKQNAFYYLDQCLGDFFTDVKNSPAWDHLLVILLPDHSIDYGKLNEQHPDRNHIPMIWAGGAVKSPRHVVPVCNQTDLPATLLGQLGISHTDFTFSRDVLSSTYIQPAAIHTYNNGLSMIDSASFVVYDLTTQQTISHSGKSNPRLAEQGKAILQAASKDLKER